MTSEEKNLLLARLAQSEDQWVERKQSYKEQEVRRTVVGFANSVGEGQTAVLFIGADNKGRHKGVSDADETQREIGNILKRCYLPIRYQLRVLSVEIEGKRIEIVAILVPFSKSRPHFAGLAYIRRGSETIEASRDVFLELIASQNDKARRILQFKDKRCWLRLESKSGFWLDFECIVGSCDAHAVTLRDDESRLWSFPVPGIKVNKTPMRDLEIVATPPGMEEEFIRDIVHRWARFRKRPAPGEYHLASDWLVSQLLANSALVLPTVAALADSSDNLWLRLLHLHVRFALKKSEHSTPRHQKLRRLETRFHEMMKGQFPLSNSKVIAAAVHSTVEVATSLREAEEFLKHLAKQHPGVAQVGYETLWNALLWELKL
jgi:hypothetical protein